MADHSELKRSAKRVIDIEVSDGDEPVGEAWDQFESVATPSAVLALIAENERMKTLRSKTERDLAQELEVWRHGPSCWNCGDTGDVHDMVGEWRGQCDCNAAKLIEVASERDQLKADNEALRKDAERYRWLRIDDWWRSPMCVIRNPKDQAKLGSDCPSSDRLDAAIDAAIGKGEQS